MAEPKTAAPTAEPVFDIPTHCKAGIVHNEGPDFTVTVETVPVPTPGPNDVLIKLNCTGICYSDIHYMMNDIGAPKMSELGVHSPGHEGAGVVVKVGENVTNFKVGDRAGIKPLMDVCQNCEECWAGKDNLCRNGTHTGIMVAGIHARSAIR
jgi:propanol-preferring alcohol dehydrogenase